MNVILENYKRILENAESAKRKAGNLRFSNDLRIMAVTKTVSAEKINQAVSCGIKLLGENRVQEFLEKRDDYSPEAEVHFIGALQKNKVKRIIDLVNMIHSIDGVELAEEIDKRAASSDKVMDALIEVNIGREPLKSGVNPDGSELFELIERIIEDMPRVRLRGLMTIPPFGTLPEAYFERMNKMFLETRAKLKDGSNFDTLSMGMSSDYEKAIFYGANIVRIGTSLFGNRL